MIDLDVRQDRLNPVIRLPRRSQAGNRRKRTSVTLPTDLQGQYTLNGSSELAFIRSKSLGMGAYLVVICDRFHPAFAADFWVRLNARGARELGGIAGRLLVSNHGPNDVGSGGPYDSSDKQRAPGNARLRDRDGNGFWVVRWNWARVCDRWILAALCAGRWPSYFCRYVGIAAPEVDQYPGCSIKSVG